MFQAFPFNFGGVFFRGGGQFMPGPNGNRPADYGERNGENRPSLPVPGKSKNGTDNFAPPTVSGTKKPRKNFRGFLKNIF
jgi:hypothetical protein